MKTGKVLLLLVLGLILYVSCESDDKGEAEFESTAIISGFDLALCACCGGYIINIEGEESENRFSELPQNSDINLESVTFPISINLNWTESEEYCEKGVIVDSFEIIE